jgi:hypothetical protein
MIQYWSTSKRVSLFHSFKIRFDVVAKNGLLFTEMDSSKENSGNEIGHRVLLTDKELSAVRKFSINFN